MSANPDHIRQQAIRWFMQLREVPVDAPERSQFERWLLTDIRHQQAYRLIEDTMSDFSSLERIEQLTGAMQQQHYFDQTRKKRKLSRLGSGLATMVLSIGLSLLGWQQYQHWQSLPLTTEVQTTAIAQMSKRTLSDGSKIIANANTRLEIAFYRQQRVVTLKQGEAIFEVSKDPQRPFIVQTRLAKVTVLGTRFAVNQLGKLVRISVDHGLVAVSNSHGQTIHLRGGQVAEVKLNQAPQTVKRRASDAFSFIEKRVIFDQADMFEVADTLSRYRIPALTALFFGERTPRVDAVLNIGQVEEFIRTLPQSVPVKLTQNGQQLEIQPR